MKNALSASACTGCTGPRDTALEEAYVEAEVMALRQRWDVTTCLPCRDRKLIRARKRPWTARFLTVPYSTRLFLFSLLLCAVPSSEYATVVLDSLQRRLAELPESAIPPSSPPGVADTRETRANHEEVFATDSEAEPANQEEAATTGPTSLSVQGRDGASGTDATPFSPVTTHQVHMPESGAASPAPVALSTGPVPTPAPAPAPVPSAPRTQAIVEVPHVYRGRFERAVRAVESDTGARLTVLGTNRDTGLCPILVTGPPPAVDAARERLDQVHAPAHHPRAVNHGGSEWRCSAISFVFAQR